MAKKRYYDYPGEQLVVRFEPARCIHAAECVKGLPGVFERHRGVDFRWSRDVR